MRYSYALDKQLELDRWLSIEGPTWFDQSELKRLGMKAGTTIANPGQALIECGLSLKSRNTYFWSENVCRLIESTAGSMPDWTLLDHMLPPDGFFWFDKPLPLPLWDGEQVPLVAVSWCNAESDEQGGRHFFFWEKMDRYEIPLTIFTWPFGVQRTVVYAGRAERLFVRDANTDDDDYDEALAHSEARDDMLLRYIAAAVSFIEQRLLFVSKQRPDRAARRRSPSESEPAIQVVELRRKHAASVSAGVHREWSVQWMVSGHWRNQWYPKLQRHQPKWIAAYTKGPDDKPLKTPRPRVFAVVR